MHKFPSWMLSDFKILGQEPEGTKYANAIEQKNKDIPTFINGSGVLPLTCRATAPDNFQM